jgi:iron-sulfur cluster assembly protein
MADCGHSHEHGHEHGLAQAPAAPPPRFAGQVLIADKAAEKLKELMEAEKKDPAAYGLRLGVKGGGCSGMTYFMDFDTAREEDQVFTHAAGARVIVDPRSMMYLNGSMLDYTEGLMGSGFTIKNPNVKGSCGCGHSFTT